ncbi:MAG: porin family protein [Rickettsiales bacterium]
MIKNIALVSFLTVSALSTSALAAEIQKDQKNYYFQVNGGGSYGTVPKGDFSESAKSAWSSVWGAEIGYKFDDNFRAGLELSYRPNFTPKDTTTSTDEEEGISESTTYRSQYKIKSFTAMANLYYDILTINNITPYATVGFGLARNTVREKEIRDSTFTDEYGSDSGTTISNITTSKNSFAYKLGFGAKYAFNKDFDFDLRYQYVNLGKIRANQTKVSTLEIGKLRSQEVVLGIAYKF